MPAIVHISNLWEHTLNESLNQDAKLEVGIIISAWVKHNKLVLHHAHWNLKQMIKWLVWRLGWTDLGRQAGHFDGHKTRKHNLCHKFLSIPYLFLLFFFCFSASFLFEHSRISIPLHTMINKATLDQVLLKVMSPSSS